MEALGVNNRNMVSSLITIGLATIFLVGSLKYGFGRFSRPGPGLLPFFTSLIAIFLSGIIFFDSLSKRKENSEKGEKFLPDKGILIRQIVGVLSLFGYGVALEYLGFAFTTMLFMVVVLRFVGLKKNWAMILLISLVTTLTCYVLFVILLKSQLPSGIFL
jgi:putative tricarboxylic transport membrane protein